MRIGRRAVLGGAGVGVAAMLAAAPIAAAGRTAARHAIGEIELFRLPVNRRGDWILVRLGASGGLTGLGDASHGGDDAKTIGYLKRFAGLLRGRSPFNIEWFRAATASAVAAEPGKSAIVAASALEQCLWDLIGHALEVPCHQLLGGRVRETIPLYANINRSTDPRTPEGFARMAARAVAEGFGAVKLAPFDAIAADPAKRTDVARLTDEGVACVAAVREAIGPSRKLLIDAHSRFTREQGLALAERLAPFELYWLEEVTPAEPIGDLAAINRAAPMRTAGGESVRGIAAFYDYIRGGAADTMMPDVKICGGMLELKKIAAMAQAAGLEVSPHGPASPIGGLAAAHVSATLPNFTMLEHSFGEVPWRAELIEAPEAIAGGELHFAEAPGLGHRLNDREVARRAA